MPKFCQLGIVMFNINQLIYELPICFEIDMIIVFLFAQQSLLLPNPLGFDEGNRVYRPHLLLRQQYNNLRVKEKTCCSKVCHTVLFDLLPGFLIPIAHIGIDHESKLGVVHIERAKQIRILFCQPRFNSKDLTLHFLKQQAL